MKLSANSVLISCFCSLLILGVATSAAKLDRPPQPPPQALLQPESGSAAGGVDATSIPTVIIQSGDNFTVNNLTAPFLVAQSSFVGCFLRGPQYLAGARLLNTNMTLELCLEHCYNNGFLFFGLGAGLACSCGVRPQGTTKPRNDPKSSCSTPCRGNSSQLHCGGIIHTAVYQMPILQGDCPTSYSQYGSSCFRGVSYHQSSMKGNWSTAYNECMNDGAMLASITSSKQDHYVMSLANMGNTDPNAINYFWLGGRREILDPNTQLSTLSWVDGWADTSYQPFMETTPGATSTTRNCLADTSQLTAPSSRYGNWVWGNCGAQIGFICERPLLSQAINGGMNNSIDAVEAIQTRDGQVVTRDFKTEVFPRISPDLTAAYSFSRVAYDSSTQKFKIEDQTAHGRDLVVRGFVQGSAPDPVVADIGPTSAAPKALHFKPAESSGAMYLEAKNTGWSLGSLLTLTFWIRPSEGSRNRDQLVMGQLINGSSSSSSNSSSYVAAVHLKAGGHLCPELNGVVFCASVVQGVRIPYEVWTLVSISFTGDLITFMLNGTIHNEMYVGPGTISANNDNRLFPVNDHPWSIGWIRPSSSSSLANPPDNAFEGYLSETLLSGNSFDSGLNRLVSLSLLSQPSSGSISIYSGSRQEISLLALFNSDAADWERRVLMSDSPCDQQQMDAAAVDRSSKVTINPQNSAANGGLTVGSFTPKAVVTSTAGIKYLCTSNPASPSTFNVSLGFTVEVAQVSMVSPSSLDQTNTPVVLPQELTLYGNGLQVGQGIGLALHPDCLEVFQYSSLRYVSGGGTSATVGLFVLPAEIEEIYICWTAKIPDGGIAPITTGPYANASIGVPLYDFGASVDTGVGVQVIANNTFKKTIAVNGGLEAFDLHAYLAGRRLDENNFVENCNRYTSSLADNFVLQVDMGDFTDYYIPDRGATLCDVITATGSGKRPYRYTATYPVDLKAWDGLLYPISSAPATVFGGSSQGFPQDSRTYLNIWGSTGSVGNNELGGCCLSYAGQYGSWDRAFRITAYQVDLQHHYALRLQHPPTAVYAGTSFPVEAALVNARGERYVPEVAELDILHWIIEVKWKDGRGEDFTQVLGHNQSAISLPLLIQPHINDTFISEQIFVEISINVEFFSGLEFLNKYSVLVYEVPTGAQTLAPDGSITTYLSWGSNYQVKPSAYYLMDNQYQDDWFVNLGGAYNLQPKSGQKSTGVIYDYSTFSARSQRFTNEWTPVTLTTNTSTTSNPKIQGLSDYIELAPGLVGYWACALYSPIDQFVDVVVDNREFAQVAISGTFKSIPGGSSSAYNSNYTLGRVSLSAGWSQVIIKAKADNYGNPGSLKVKVFGSAIATGYETRPGIPTGAVPIVPGIALTDILTLSDVASSAIESALPASILLSPPVSTAIADPQPDPFEPSSNEYEIRPYDLMTSVLFDQPLRAMVWKFSQISASELGYTTVPSSMLGGGPPSTGVQMPVEMYYFSFGVWAAATGLYSFTLSSSPWLRMRVTVDGAVAFQRAVLDAHSSSLESFTNNQSVVQNTMVFELSAGWNQVLVKAAAPNAVQAKFAIWLAMTSSSSRRGTHLSSNLAVSASIPRSLPYGVTPVPDGPLTLWSTVEADPSPYPYAVPLNRTLFNVDTSFLNTSSSTSNFHDGAGAVGDVVPMVTPKRLDKVRLPVSNSFVGYTWYTILNPAGNILLNEYLGGHFSTYSYVSLYSTSAQTISGSVERNYGVKIWLNDNVTMDSYFTPSPENATGSGALSVTNSYVNRFSGWSVKKGWNDLFVRATAPLNFEIQNSTVPLTSAGFNRAIDICNAQKKKLCELAAWCPLGLPRGDYIPLRSQPTNVAGNFSSSFTANRVFAPVYEFTSSQQRGTPTPAWTPVAGALREQGKTLQQCQHYSDQDISTYVTTSSGPVPPPPAVGLVACCEAIDKVPTMKFTVTSDSPQAQLGTWFSKRSTVNTLPTPVISTVYNEDRRVKCTITEPPSSFSYSASIKIQVRYKVFPGDIRSDPVGLVNESLPGLGSGTLYKLGHPFLLPPEIDSNGMTVVAVAYVADLNVSSPLSTFWVGPTLPITSLRLEVPRGSATPIGFKGVTPGHSIAFLSQSTSSAFRSRIQQSAVNASLLQASGTYSSLLRVDATYSVLLPRTLLPGKYWIVYFEWDLSLPSRPSADAPVVQTDVPGYTVPNQLLTVSEPDLTGSWDGSPENFRFIFNDGGIRTGDQVAFPDLLRDNFFGRVNCPTDCASAALPTSSWKTVESCQGKPCAVGNIREAPGMPGSLYPFAGLCLCFRGQQSNVTITTYAASSTVRRSPVGTNSFVSTYPNTSLTSSISPCWPPGKCHPSGYTLSLTKSISQEAQFPQPTTTTSAVTPFASTTGLPTTVLPASTTSAPTSSTTSTLPPVSSTTTTSAPTSSTTSTTSAPTSSTTSTLPPVSTSTPSSTTVVPSPFMTTTTAAPTITTARETSTTAGPLTTESSTTTSKPSTPSTTTNREVTTSAPTTFTVSTLPPISTTNSPSPSTQLTVEIKSVFPTTVASGTPMQVKIACSAGFQVPSDTSDIGVWAVSSSGARVNARCSIQNGGNNTHLTAIWADIPVGQYGEVFLVLDFGSFQTGGLRDRPPPLILTPPMPAIEGASGPCADSEMNCRSGSVLTFSGKNFNTGLGRTTLSFVSPVNLKRSLNAFCDIEKIVSETWFRCTLRFQSGFDFSVDSKFFAEVSVQTSETTYITNMSTNMFTFGSNPGAGWSGKAAIVPAAANTTPVSHKSGGLGTGTIAGIVVGVMVVMVLLGVIAAKMRAKGDRATGEYLGDGDYIESMTGGGDRNNRRFDIQYDEPTYGVTSAGRRPKDDNYTPVMLEDK